MRAMVGKAAVTAVAAALMVLAACGDDGGGSAGSKAEWEEEHGELVAAYSRDLSVALNTINQGERTATLNTCQQVKDDANEVKSTALPVPNSAVDGPLRSAVDLGIKAADACIQGGRNTDARAVEAAQRDFGAARQAMDDAEAALKAWS